MHCHPKYPGRGRGRLVPSSCRSTLEPCGGGDTLSPAPGESVGALTQPSQGTYMCYRFPPVLVRVSRLAGVMNLIIHICTGRRRALSGVCLGTSSLHHLFSPPTPGPTIWENPYFHHVWSDVVTPSSLFHIAGSISILPWPLAH